MSQDPLHSRIPNNPSTSNSEFEQINQFFDEKENAQQRAVEWEGRLVLDQGKIKYKKSLGFFYWLITPSKEFTLRSIASRVIQLDQTQVDPRLLRLFEKYNLKKSDTPSKKIEEHTIQALATHISMQFHKLVHKDPLPSPLPNKMISYIQTLSVGQLTAALSSLAPEVQNTLISHVYRFYLPDQNIKAVPLLIKLINAASTASLELFFQETFPKEPNNTIAFLLLENAPQDIIQKIIHLFVSEKRFLMIQQLIDFSNSNKKSELGKNIQDAYILEITKAQLPLKTDGIYFFKNVIPLENLLSLFSSMVRTQTTESHRSLIESQFTQLIASSPYLECEKNDLVTFQQLIDFISPTIFLTAKWMNKTYITQNTQKLSEILINKLCVYLNNNDLSQIFPNNQEKLNCCLNILIEYFKYIEPSDRKKLMSNMISHNQDSVIQQLIQFANSNLHIGIELGTKLRNLYISRILSNKTADQLPNHFATLTTIEDLTNTFRFMIDEGEKKKYLEFVGKQFQHLIETLQVLDTPSDLDSFRSLINALPSTIFIQMNLIGNPALKNNPHISPILYDKLLEYAKNPTPWKQILNNYTELNTTREFFCRTMLHEKPLNLSKTLLSFLDELPQENLEKIIGDVALDTAIIDRVIRFALSHGYMELVREIQTIQKNIENQRIQALNPINLDNINDQIKTSKTLDEFILLFHQLFEKGIAETHRESIEAQFTKLMRSGRYLDPLHYVSAFQQLVDFIPSTVFLTTNWMNTSYIDESDPNLFFILLNKLFQYTKKPELWKVLPKDKNSFNLKVVQEFQKRLCDEALVHRSNHREIDDKWKTKKSSIQLHLRDKIVRAFYTLKKYESNTSVTSVLFEQLEKLSPDSPEVAIYIKNYRKLNP